jgi:hypothetical protein
VINQVERQMILQNALAMEAAQGNRVAWVGSGVAHVWRMPAPVNNTVHAILTLFTFGFWLLFWLLAVATQPKAQLVGIYVDDWGVPQYFDVRAAQQREVAAYRAQHAH